MQFKKEMKQLLTAVKNDNYLWMVVKKLREHFIVSLFSFFLSLIGSDILQSQFDKPLMA